MQLNKFLDVKPEVAEAIAAGKPVVALESTIISHGMPYPQNVQTALEVERIFPIAFCPIRQPFIFEVSISRRFPCNAHRHPRESRIPIIQNTSCILGTFSSTVIPRFNTDAAIIGKTAFFDPCTVSPP